MSTSPRLGELLRRSGRLSAADVDAILAEQSAKSRRFGEIAVEMGKCREHDVEAAWCAQLSFSPRHVSLKDFTVDPRAVAMVPSGVAREFTAMPVRTVGRELVVATTPEAYPRARAELAGVLGRAVKLVTTDAGALRRTIELYYSPLAAAS